MRSARRPLNIGEETWRRMQMAHAAAKNPRRARLKPCPFCGNKARMADKGGPLPYAVECVICHASTTRYRLQGVAVERWNWRRK